MPVSATVVAASGDAACRQPIQVAALRHTAASCADAAPVPRLAPKAVAPPSGTCGPALELYEVGARHTDPVYFQGVRCEADASRDFYDTGARHAASELPAATVVVDL